MKAGIISGKQPGFVPAVPFHVSGSSKCSIFRIRSASSRILTGKMTCRPRLHIPGSGVPRSVPGCRGEAVRDRCSAAETEAGAPFYALPATQTILRPGQRTPAFCGLYSDCSFSLIFSKSIFDPPDHYITSTCHVFIARSPADTALPAFHRSAAPGRCR